MARSGEGKHRVFMGVPSRVVAGVLLRSGVVKPMGSEPSSCGVLLGIGAAPFGHVSRGEAA